MLYPHKSYLCITIQLPLYHHPTHTGHFLEASGFRITSFFFIIFPGQSSPCFVEMDISKMFIYFFIGHVIWLVGLNSLLSLSRDSKEPSPLDHRQRILSAKYLKESNRIVSLSTHLHFFPLY